MFARLRRGDKPAVAILARFAQWWVVLERSEEIIRIGGAGTASVEGAANAVSDRTDRATLRLETAGTLRPVTLDADALLAAAKKRRDAGAFLSSQRLEADQLQMLMMATDPKRSGQASIVAVQSGMEAAGPTRTQVEQSVVTIIDTPEGRLVAEHVLSAGKKWMVIAPGTATNIANAVNQMVRRLPANQEWHSYRKVV